MRRAVRFLLIGSTGVAAGLAAAQFIAGAIAQIPPICLLGFAVLPIAIWSFTRNGTPTEALLASLCEAFDQLPEARLIASADGHTVHANLAFKRLFAGGGESSLDCLEPRAGGLANTAALHALRERAIAGEPAAATIPLCVAGDGPSHPFAISVETSEAPEGYRQWTFRDAGNTDAVRAAPAEHWRSIAVLCDRLQSGFCCLDNAGHVVAVNRTLAQWLGIGPEIVRHGNSLDDLMAGSTGQEPASRLLLEASAASGSAELRTPCGKKLDAWAAPAVPGAGSLVYVVFRQKTGDEADHGNQSPGLFQHFFANAPVGIAIVDRAGRFINANRALGALFDAPPEALTGRQLTQLLAPHDRDAVAERIARAPAAIEDCRPIEIRREPPSERTMVLLFGDFPAAARSTADERILPPPANALDPVSNTRRPAETLMLYFIDVTERKHLETQFVQSQKMQAVGQLAGGIAHDFNNLLTAMIGFSDLLLLRSRPGDPTFADIMQIRQNANRAANLVRQLLAFSRQQSLQPRVLDITDILVELSHLLRRLIGENIRLELGHGRNLGLVKVDQGQFEQVIINLVVNARDAMPAGGRLTVRTKNAHQPQPQRRGDETMPAGDFVVIEIADTGVGIAPGDLGRIFEPFFSTKDAGSGTGLGLSTVYGIVKQTGGFVAVESDLGRGTTFSIYLPRHEVGEGVIVSPAEAADAVLPRDLTGTGVIMLVEDDDAVRMFAARALRNKGYRVIEAKSGETALGLMRHKAEPIDLLITDVVMPQLDGPGLIRAVRDLGNPIRVIYISGYAEDTFRQRLDRDSDIHFLSKPFTLKQLLVKVKDVMAGDLDPSSVQIAS